MPTGQDDLSILQQLKVLAEVSSQEVDMLKDRIGRLEDEVFALQGGKDNDYRKEILSLQTCIAELNRKIMADREKTKFIYETVKTQAEFITEHLKNTNGGMVNLDTAKFDMNTNTFMPVEPKPSVNESQIGKQSNNVAEAFRAISPQIEADKQKRGA